MRGFWLLLGVGLVVGAGPGSSAYASGREMAVIESSTEVLQSLASAGPFKFIPAALLQDAKGVAVIPNVLKAGFVLGGRYGRGVVLVRLADGTWSNPVFITLAGGGIGWQIGVQSTDLVLVFKTSNSLERVINGKGKVTLGADVAVAAGPVGRQASAGTDGQLKAEIYSYSRSRGLFAGLSLEGAGLMTDFDANADYYRLRGGQPADVIAGKVVPTAGAESLKLELTRLTTPPPPPTLLPPQPAPGPAIPPQPPVYPVRP